MKNQVLQTLRSFRNKIGLLFAIRKNVSVGSNIHVGAGSIIESPNHLSIGNDVYIGKYCTVECDGSIGNSVMIANCVGLIGRYDHDYTAVGLPLRKAPWIGEPDYTGLGKGLKIQIEDDVWIGYGAIVLSGVTIGRGSIIAAGSIVTRDIPPYSIAIGSPATVKGARFSDCDIVEHEKVLYPKSASLKDEI